MKKFLIMTLALAMAFTTIACAPDSKEEPVAEEVVTEEVVTAE